MTTFSLSIVTALFIYCFHFIMTLEAEKIIATLDLYPLADF